ncbi:flagellar hook-associated protein FlgL [Amphibacillus cookii]|uniref:flagellar hook-associated protein FlgL n=1 Tax=Amphibacillus cookii TaxID=767787 RepID=UPI00195D8CF0|nr:flagellar hook-associated protein FlgL [Amphibacillus cookii]MBM7540023.1 flagellar hook-associated protein 3 FlgL [Amphibacillus cookii]
MRVSQSMISNNMLKNIGSSYGSLSKYMNQLSSGKKITRPSDDPVVAMKGMGYRSQLSNIEQYERNLGEVHNWLNNTDDAMDETTQILHRINELTVQASNGTYDGDDRANIAKEVDQLIDQLVDVANTRVNGKFIFNGTDTTGEVDGDGNRVQPFIRNDDGTFEVSDNDGQVLIEVSSGVKFQANSNPTNVFTEDFFDDLQELFTALNDENTPDEDISPFLNMIEGHTQTVLDERATIGGRMNRIDLIENRLKNQNISAKSMMSDNEDIDLEEVIMNLVMQEAVHRASLSAGARVLQPSLLDFMR